MTARIFRHAIRTLRRSPGFAAAAVLTLALGIGANTAVFSVVDNALLRPLPYTDANRLVGIRDVNRSGSGGGVMFAKFPIYRDTRSFEGVAGYERMSRALTGSGIPEQVLGEAVTPNLFALVGVHPAIGRTFRPDDDRVAILTHGFWQRRFGGDRSMVGRALLFNDLSYEVIGVMPAAFEPLSQPGSGFRIDFFLPELGDASRTTVRQINVVGRLATNTTPGQAQSELRSLASGHELQPIVEPLRDRFVRGQLRLSLSVMFGAVVLVLLVACVNLGNLFLVHALGQQRELATRIALGATRREIAMELGARGLVLGAAGGALGLAVGIWIRGVLVAMAPPTIPGLDHAALNPRVLAFTIVSALASGVAASVLPILHVSRRDLTAAMISAGRSVSGSRATARWRGLLIGAEIAAAMVLCIGAALLVRSHVALSRVEIGFRTDDVLMFTVRLPETRYPERSAKLTFFEELERRVTAVPGVRAATFTDALPARGGNRLTITAPDSTRVAVDYQIVSPGYFEVLRIPIERGRAFTASDRAGSEPVAIVSETLVRFAFGNRDPLGERIMLPAAPSPVTIIGIVGEIMRDGPDARLAPQVYVPAAQSPQVSERLAEVGVLAERDPLALIPEMQRLVASIDPSLPITHTRKLDDILAGATAPRRFNLLLIGSLALLAIALALIGVYGVVAHVATERRREIGIRIALGASPRHVVAAVATASFAWALAGVAVGSIGAYAVAGLMARLLFGVPPTDPATFVSSIILLLLVCATATLLPAGRAVSVDPVESLRID